MGSQRKASNQQNGAYNKMNNALACTMDEKMHKLTGTVLASCILYLTRKAGLPVKSRIAKKLLAMTKTIFVTRGNTKRYMYTSFSPEVLYKTAQLELSMDLAADQAPLSSLWCVCITRREFQNR